MCRDDVALFPALSRVADALGTCALYAETPRRPAGLWRSVIAASTISSLEGKFYSSEAPLLCRTSMETIPEDGRFGEY